MEPRDTTPALPALTALVTAVKPLYWGAALVAAAVWGYAKFDARIADIEHDVRVIRLILCEGATADSYCRDGR